MEDPRIIAERLIDNVEKVIVGKHQEVRLAVIALLCQGHMLIEDVPGVGKTILARSIARSTGCTFRRMQFTPDLLPSDITGVSIYNQKTGDFEFRPGPVMAQVVLADEINRATPKTQSALLEAMEERQVTVDGVTHAVTSGAPAEPNIPSGLGGGAVQPSAPAEEASRAAASRTGWVIMGLLLGLLALIVTGAGAARWAWQWGLGDLDQVGRVWAKTVRLASWARLAPRPQQTPREFARDLDSELGGVEGLELLAESYSRSRFGKQAPSESEKARLDAVWRVLRRRLVARVLRRRPGRS